MIPALSFDGIPINDCKLCNHLLIFKSENVALIYTNNIPPIYLFFQVSSNGQTLIKGWTWVLSKYVPFPGALEQNQANEKVPLSKLFRWLHSPISDN